jgi:chloramphenicol-sensitive protein RarD
VQTGILFALAAYILWGILPVYWKALGNLPAYEILCHRIIWSHIFLLLILLFRKNWRWIKIELKRPLTLLTYAGSSLFIGFNWLIYIWAVNSGHLVQASLGYFINPLVSVLLGVFFLKEKLRTWQWFAIILATSGVLYLTAFYRAFPWIALFLAFSFGIYGLLRKTGKLNSVEGLTFETALLFLPAFIFLIMLELRGSASLGHVGMGENMLLLFSGVITAIPLLFFASAARRIHLSMVGILQYITPTIQFLLGVFVYRETFSGSRLVGFVIIWLALIIYTSEGLLSNRAEKKVLEIGKS